MPPPDQKKHAFQPPKGTRDFYPEQMLRRRYIEKAWRDTSIRHGFDEIDGPTFEHTDLYTVKSGDAILGEVFNVFSGKDEEQVKGAAAGQAKYALRPEFTPTLARMYAAQAGSLPKPTKWFWQQNCYRAERPQRGRLREFGQWNVDFLGDTSPEADADLIACCVAALQSLGLTALDVRLRYSHRVVLSIMLDECGIASAQHPDWLVWIDRYDKLPPDARRQAAIAFGGTDAQIRDVESIWSTVLDPSEATRAGDELERQGKDDVRESTARKAEHDVATKGAESIVQIQQLQQALHARNLLDWVEQDFKIVRGLAYYTGMVFEVHEISGAERAIAGGGRYDNLIELFGGPPTPAVGFGMGDVVLGNILEDKGLMPKGKAMLDKLSEPPASLRPDVFVIANENEESQSALRPLVATLRRAGLHARHSYKTTKNIGKLLKEAADVGSRFAAIIESGSEATLKDLDSGSQDKIAIADVEKRAARVR